MANAPRQADIKAPGIVGLNAEHKYDLHGYSFANVKHVDLIDVDIILTMDDGVQVLMPGAGMEALSETPPYVAFSDQNVSLSQIFGSIGSADSQQVEVIPFSTLHDNASSKGDTQSDSDAAKIQEQKISNIEISSLTINTEANVLQMVSNAKQIDEQIHRGDAQRRDETVHFVNTNTVSLPPGVAPPISLTPQITIFEGNVSTITTDTTTNPGYTTVSGGDGIAGTEAAAQLGPRSVEQFSNIDLVGTSGNDIIYVDGPQVGNSNPAVSHSLNAKEILVVLSGYFTRVYDAVVSGLPDGVSVEGAVSNGDGTYTVPANFIINSTAFKLLYDANAWRSSGGDTFEMKIKVSGLSTHGQLFERTETFYFKFIDVTDASQVTDASLIYYDNKGIGHPIYVLPTSGHPSTIDTYDGNDYVYGGLGADTITSGNGNNHIYAAEGDNIVAVGNGDNVITATDNAGSGVKGNNTITVGNGSNSITLGSGNNTVSLGTGNNTVSLGSGNNHVASVSGNEHITTTGGAATINLGAGSQTIVTGDGNDTVTLTTGGGSINVGGGNNAIAINNSTTGAVDTYTLTTTGSGANTITANDGHYTVNMSGGTNAVTLGDGASSITGQDGLYTINVGDGTETIHLGSGADAFNTQITAGAGAHDIVTGNGKHTVTLGAGDAQVTTGSGVDAITVNGGGGGAINAGDGDNVLNLYTTGAVIDVYSLIVGNGNNAIMAQDGTYTVTAGNGNNAITLGNSPSNQDGYTTFDTTITAGNGNNTIVTGGGTHLVTVGDGANDVKVGSGKDVVVTGSGSNRIRLGLNTNYLYAGTGGIYQTAFAGTGVNILDLTDITTTPMTIAVGDVTNNYLVTATGTGVSDTAYGVTNIVGTNQADVISIVAGNHQVTLGTGASNVTVVSANAFTNVINHIGYATGGNTITLSGSGATTIYSDLNNTVGNFGTGSSAITINGQATSSNTIYTSNGNNTITINGSGSATVWCGSGNDTITIGAGATGTYLVYGGNGNNTFSGGSTTTTFYGGAGNNTFTNIIAGTHFNGTAYVSGSSYTAPLTAMANTVTYGGVTYTYQYTNSSGVLATANIPFNYQINMLDYSSYASPLTINLSYYDHLSSTSSSHYLSWIGSSYGSYGTGGITSGIMSAYGFTSDIALSLKSTQSNQIYVNGYSSINMVVTGSADFTYVIPSYSDTIIVARGGGNGFHWTVDDSYTIPGQQVVIIDASSYTYESVVAGRAYEYIPFGRNAGSTYIGYNNSPAGIAVNFSSVQRIFTTYVSGVAVGTYTLDAYSGGDWGQSIGIDPLTGKNYLAYSYGDHYLRSGGYSILLYAPPAQNNLVYASESNMLTYLSYSASADYVFATGSVVRYQASRGYDAFGRLSGVTSGTLSTELSGATESYHVDFSAANWNALNASDQISSNALKSQILNVSYSGILYGWGNTAGIGSMDAYGNYNGLSASAQTFGQAVALNYGFTLLTGLDAIVLGHGNDTVYGDSSNHWIDVGAGNNYIYDNYSGLHVIKAYAGSNTIYAGTGNDNWIIIGNAYENTSGAPAVHNDATHSSYSSNEQSALSGIGSPSYLYGFRYSGVSIFLSGGIEHFFSNDATYGDKAYFWSDYVSSTHIATAQMHTGIGYINNDGVAMSTSSAGWHSAITTTSLTRAYMGDGYEYSSLSGVSNIYGSTPNYDGLAEIYGNNVDGSYIYDVLYGNSSNNIIVANRSSILAGGGGSTSIGDYLKGSSANDWFYETPTEMSYTYASSTLSTQTYRIIGGGGTDTLRVPGWTWTVGTDPFSSATDTTLNTLLNNRIQNISVIDVRSGQDTVTWSLVTEAPSQSVSNATLTVISAIKVGNSLAANNAFTLSALDIQNIVDNGASSSLTLHLNTNDTFSPTLSAAAGAAYETHTVFADHTTYDFWTDAAHTAHAATANVYFG